MKNSIRLSVLLVSSLFLQACGKFEPIQSDLSSVGVVTPLPVPLEAVDSEIAGPSHVALGKCSAGITITAKSTPKRPQRIEFPSELTDLVFLDPSCEGRSAAADLKTSDLPKTVYFRSQALFQKNISIKIGGRESNSFLLTNYKEKFADVTKSAPGSLVMLSNYNIRQRLFNFYNSDVVRATQTITNIFFGTRRETVLTNRADGDDIISNSSGLDVSHFTKSAVEIGGQRIATSATAMTASVQLTNGERMSCFSAMNDVFCQTVPGSAFQKIALPDGDLQDLESQVISLGCAVKVGRVFCWKSNFIVEEISEFGDNNTAVVVPRAINTTRADTVRTIVGNGEICTLRESRVFCLIAGELIALDYAGVRRIWSGPLFGFIIIQGVQDGETYVKAEGLENGVGYSFPAGLKFDEVYPLNLDESAGGELLQGCGRIENRLLCFEGEPALTITESVEKFDIR